jgi:hypothetical protein
VLVYFPRWRLAASLKNFTNSAKILWVDPIRAVPMAGRPVDMWTSDAIVENRERQETLEPLLAALEHIAVKGSLLLLAPDHEHRVRIMKAMAELELVEWNAGTRKYEMTPYGRQCLAEYRRRQN